MISNKYYVTTIIAIFLSLSIGILIGGTLGQQWINFNQQKLITYYEQKSTDLEKINKELKAENDDTYKHYQDLKNELYTLYTKSISNSLKDKEFLFITDAIHANNSIRDTIVLAGGNISEIEDTLAQNINIENYDVIILNADDQAKANKYQWLNNYKTPVMYIGDNQEIWLNNYKNSDSTLIQFIKTGSYNDNYRFIYYLRNILQEQEKK